MTYVDIAGVHTHYEVTGAGPRVVLLHGGIVGADSWYAQRTDLAAAFTVYTPERRGHGRTPDVAGEITYQLMAQDTVGFLETVLDGPAHLVGWSDGAVVGALVAMQRPELVSRLVLIGQYYNPDGRPEGGLVTKLAEGRDNPPAFLRDMYDKVSPDGPEHFPVFYNKMVDLFEREPNIPLPEFAAIQAPTLVLQGDRDDVLVTHSSAVVAAIPDARLAVLPGTHSLPLESPALVNRLIADFLSGGPAELTW